jgi:NitT/TauT family transport system permease protein
MAEARATSAGARLGRTVEMAAWFLGFLVAWELLVRVTGVSDLLLPAPSAFIVRLFTGWNSIFPQALVTLEWIVIGFLAGAIPAVPLGFAVVMVPFLRQTLYPFLVFLNVIPKVALVPLLLVWFGFGGMPKVIVAALLVFFPIMVNCIAGFESLDPRLLHITRSMGASRWQTLWYLRLPTAMPFIISGMKISTVLAVTVVVVSEFVGSNDGLGYLILRATANHDLALAFAALFVAGVIGLVLSFLGDLLERASRHWTVQHAE